MLGAAIAGGAQSIVTVNLKDFPADHLAGRGIEATHPDKFLLDQLDLRPSHALEILVQQAAALRNSPMDLAGLLRALERSGVANFVEASGTSLPRTFSGLARQRLRANPGVSAKT